MLRTAVMLMVFCLTFLAGPLEGADLVLHYDFEDGGNLGLDVSGHGNHGTVSGTVTQVVGRDGETMAASFNGSSMIFRNGGLSGYDGQPGLTFAAWVYLDPATSDYSGVISQDNGGCCIHRLMLEPSLHQPFVDLGAHDDRTYPAPQPTGTWFHLVLVGEDSGANREGRVYVNGIEVAGSPQLFAGNLLDSSALNTYVGAGEGGGPYRLLGSLDDVQIYDGALTTQQVEDLYLAAVSAEIPTVDFRGLALLAAVLTAAAVFVIARR